MRLLRVQSLLVPLMLLLLLLLLLVVVLSFSRASMRALSFCSTDRSVTTICWLRRRAVSPSAVACQPFNYQL